MLSELIDETASHTVKGLLTEKLVNAELQFFQTMLDLLGAEHFFNPAQQSKHLSLVRLVSWLLQLRVHLVDKRLQHFGDIGSLE
jgi:hypothetical protein